MHQIVKIAEGAFFVPSYSEQTVLGFQPGITSQTVLVCGDIGIAPSALEEMQEMEREKREGATERPDVWQASAE